MSGTLSALQVLIVDCQASGATPAHGDLLEVGWAVADVANDHVPARAHWIRPATERPVSRTVRKLTGWDDGCLETAIDPAVAWQLVRDDASLARASSTGAATPTVIHFARFELAFLRDLHARTAAEDAFPLDAVCLHAIGARLFPDLPRRNLRALSGHLGHSPDLQRRALGHVDASTFIWRALVPKLEEAGVRTWEELKVWLEAPTSSSRTRSGKRVFPMPATRRKELPDASGVYRFLRPNGDVLYVGKATSIKKRVASYFTSKSTVERTLEMLSQAHDVDVTETPSPLEAALLETDEIKRLDPPYNVQLRAGDRSAWFASRSWSATVSSPDEEHRVGPLPSRGALRGLAAMHALLDGVPLDEGLRAAAVGVPTSFAPDAADFDEVWTAFVAEHLSGSAPARTRILRAAKRIVVPAEKAETDDDGPEGWDPATVRRHLERTIVGEALLVQRARLLALLSDAHVVFTEPRARSSRLLVLAGSEIVRQADIAGPDDVPLAIAAPPSRWQRLASFDAARYDRLRVLATELRRIVDQGGSVTVRVGRHVLMGIETRAHRLPGFTPVGACQSVAAVDGRALPWSPASR